MKMKRYIAGVLAGAVMIGAVPTVSLCSAFAEGKPAASQSPQDSGFSLELKITHAPDKVQYLIGEELDLTGLTVNAYESYFGEQQLVNENDSVAEHPDRYTVSGFDSSYTHECVVTVTYKVFDVPSDKWVKAEASFTVSVGTEDGSIVPNLKPVFEDFDSNLVNGKVEISIAEGLSGMFAVTFDSPEGKELPYYSTPVGAGEYSFDIEGFDKDSEDWRLYKVSFLPNNSKGIKSESPFEIVIDVPEIYTAPDGFVTYHYDFKEGSDEEHEVGVHCTKDEGNTKEITFVFKKYTLGDVDEDGKVTAADASLTLTEYSDRASGASCNLTPAQQLAADVDGDNKITAADASTILTYYSDMSSGQTPTWPIEQSKA